MARSLLDRHVAKRIVMQRWVECGSHDAGRIVPNAYDHRQSLDCLLSSAALRRVVLAVQLAVLACGGQSGPSDVAAGKNDDLAGAAGSSAALDGTGDPPSAGEEDGMPSVPALSAEQFDAAVVTPPDTDDRPDTTGGAWRVIEVPTLSFSASVVRTPSGWMALSYRYLGNDPRAPSGVESGLYRSSDGIQWQLIPLANSNHLRLDDLAYGAGRYVMVGANTAGSVVWTSSDGEHWTESLQLLSAPHAWGRLAFVKDRFFAFGFAQLGMSSTGESWEALPTHIVQGGAGAYGNGRYLLLGNGPMQTSEDGRTWQEHSLDCSLPASSCITDPSGGVAQGYHHAALFAEGRFFTEELSSLDGATWQAEPGLSPSAYVAGRFLGGWNLSAGLATWTRGGPPQALRVIRPAREAVTEAGRGRLGMLDRDAPLPETFAVPFDDGLTCETADCVLVGDSLLLVPPPGAPPLVDRVPRDAAGSPLLSRDCPVSSMIFCDDYAARGGCSCNPGAPRNPDYCDDVSQYRCEGHFVPRPGEWPLDELAQGGCSCDAIDPSEPPGIGRSCTAGDTTCRSPLECLGIDTPPSFGPPLGQPFVCTTHCVVDADCPSWDATGFCAGPVQLRCSGGTCQPRSCD
jgi:hypothetical protein